MGFCFLVLATISSVDSLGKLAPALLTALTLNWYLYPSIRSVSLISGLSSSVVPAVIQPEQYSTYSCGLLRSRGLASSGTPAIILGLASPSSPSSPAASSSSSSLGMRNVSIFSTRKCLALGPGDTDHSSLTHFLS